MAKELSLADLLRFIQNDPQLSQQYTPVGNAVDYLNFQAQNGVSPVAANHQVGGVNPMHWRNLLGMQTPAGMVNQGWSDFSNTQMGATSPFSGPLRR